jgi:4'-phosphopantetheinyl transferase
MGIIQKLYVNDDCLLGIWEIKEDFESLFARVKLDPREIETVYGFKNSARQVEWLSVRVLLNELTGRDSTIIYNEEHKPFLKDNSYNISISHSYKLTSVLISRTKNVGIDLEFMSHRIQHIAHKFVNNQEVVSQDPKNNGLHLYIHWCAKEALYKICDKKNINFKDNLTIMPFEPGESGRITGIHHDGKIYDEYEMQYIIQNNYAIVYCNK